MYFEKKKMKFTRVFIWKYNEPVFIIFSNNELSRDFEKNNSMKFLSINQNANLRRNQCKNKNLIKSIKIIDGNNIKNGKRDKLKEKEKIQ